MKFVRPTKLVDTMKFVHPVIFGLAFVITSSIHVAQACGASSPEAELDALRLDTVAEEDHIQALQSAEDYLQAGITHFHAKQYDLAEDAFRASLQMACRDHKIDTEISALTNLGNVLTRLGRLLEAERQFHHAIKLAQGSGKWRLEASALYNLGILYKERQEPKRAERIYRRALAALERLKAHEAPQLKTATLNNLGNLLRERGEFHRAERILRESLQLSEAYGDQEGAKIAASNLAKLYRDDYGLNGETGLAYRRSISPAKQTSRRPSSRTF